MNKFHILGTTPGYITILAVAILTPETEELLGVSAVANLGQKGAHYLADVIYLDL